MYPPSNTNNNSRLLHLPSTTTTTIESNNHDNHAPLQLHVYNHNNNNRLQQQVQQQYSNNSSPSSSHSFVNPMHHHEHHFPYHQTSKNEDDENPFVVRVRNPLSVNHNFGQGHVHTSCPSTPQPPTPAPSSAASASVMTANGGGILSRNCSKTGPRLALYRSNSSLDLIQRHHAAPTYHHHPVDPHSHLFLDPPQQQNYNYNVVNGSHGHFSTPQPQPINTRSFNTSSKLLAAQAQYQAEQAQHLKPNKHAQQGCFGSRRKDHANETDEIQHAPSPSPSHTNLSLNPVLNVKEATNIKGSTSSPRLRHKFSKLFTSSSSSTNTNTNTSTSNNSNSNNGIESSKSESSIFKILKSNHGRKTNTNINSTSMDVVESFYEMSTKRSSTDINQLTNANTDKVIRRSRRAGFIHYDVQSIVSNISIAPKLRDLLSKRRNTTTGASAASSSSTTCISSSSSSSSTSLSLIHSKSNHSSTSSNLDQQQGQQHGNACRSSSVVNMTEGAGAEGVNSSGGGDNGDGKSNHLLLSCPYFRNEIGSEEIRNIGHTKYNHHQNHHTSHNHNNQSYQSTDEEEEFHRPSIASSLSILEQDLSPVHTTICPYSNNNHDDDYVLEGIDHGSNYYQKYFYKQDHENWFGFDEILGPLAISIRRESIPIPTTTTTTTDPALIPCIGYGLVSNHFYRLIVRSTELNTLRGTVLEDSIPGIPTPPQQQQQPKKIYTKEVIEFLLPQIQTSCLRLANATTNPILVQDELSKLDVQCTSKKYKVGVMYCGPGQSTEEEMYNNEVGSAAFAEFLSLLGTKIRLKGFTGYNGGLDTKDDTTGLYSIYNKYRPSSGSGSGGKDNDEIEIIYHVSTMLPFTSNNRQQLMRKRHIGNDIVTLIFQEPGSLPFTPKNIRSQFQHVFLIVQVCNPCSDSTSYTVAVSRSKEVSLFGPPIPPSATFTKSKAFTSFLTTKIVNGENSTKRTDKFNIMATRTRHEYLKELIKNYSSSMGCVPELKSSKFPSLFGAGNGGHGHGHGSKKKELAPAVGKFIPNVIPAVSSGAVSWYVQVQDPNDLNNRTLEVYLGISSCILLVVDVASKEAIFAISTSTILGWSFTNTNNRVRIYYHQGECLTIHGPGPDLTEIISRLAAVSTGAATTEFSLQRNALGQLGFHVQSDGVITEVEGASYAAGAGLSQGSRIVEICGALVAALSQKAMIELLKTSTDMHILIIPPSVDQDGITRPRRGCDSNHCIYIDDNDDGEVDVNVGLGLRLDNKVAFANGNGIPSSSTSTQQQFVQFHAPPQPMLAGNARKRFECRSFSPPRSSNSSGYGTGSSSKSFSNNNNNNSNNDPNQQQQQQQTLLASSNTNNNQTYSSFIPPPMPEMEFNLKQRSSKLPAPAPPPPIPARPSNSNNKDLADDVVDGRDESSFIITTSASGSGALNDNPPPSSSLSKSIHSSTSSAHSSVSAHSSPAAYASYHQQQHVHHAPVARTSANTGGGGLLLNKRNSDSPQLYFNPNTNGFIRNEARNLSFQSNNANKYSATSKSQDLLHIHQPLGGFGGGGLKLWRYNINNNTETPTTKNPDPEFIVHESTIKGKVTYLTDFPLLSHSQSIEHLHTNQAQQHNYNYNYLNNRQGLQQQKQQQQQDSSSLFDQNERLAALKSAYHLNKQKQQKMASSSYSPNTKIQQQQLTDIKSNVSSQNTNRASSNNSNSNTNPANVEIVKLRQNSTSSSSSAASSNSKESKKKNRVSTLQEDLIKLINPSPSSLPTSSPSSPTMPCETNNNNNNYVKIINNGVLLRNNGNNNVKSPLHNANNVVNNGHILRNNVNRRLRPMSCEINREHLKYNNNINYSNNRQSIQNPQQQQQLLLVNNESVMNWPLLVETATKYQSLNNNQVLPIPSNNNVELNNNANNINNVNSSSPSPSSSLSLEARVAELEVKLQAEIQSKAILASQVAALRQENVRLQVESNSSADQFKKFKEWLLNTNDNVDVEGLNSSNSNTSSPL